MEVLPLQGNSYTQMLQRTENETTKPTDIVERVIHTKLKEVERSIETVANRAEWNIRIRRISRWEKELNQEEFAEFLESKSSNLSAARADRFRKLL